MLSDVCATTHSFINVCYGVCMFELPCHALDMSWFRLFVILYAFVNVCCCLLAVQNRTAKISSECQIGIFCSLSRLFKFCKHFKMSWRPGLIRVLSPESYSDRPVCSVPGVMQDRSLSFREFICVIYQYNLVD